MNWIIRAILAIAIALPLTARVNSAGQITERTDALDMQMRVADLLNREGLKQFDNPVLAPRARAYAVHFQRPGCRERSYALPYLITLDAGVTIDLLAGGRPMTVRYHYHDAARSDPDRPSALAQWAWHAGSGFLGLGNSIDTLLGVVVLDPVACVSDDGVDWPALWLRTQALSPGAV